MTRPYLNPLGFIDKLTDIGTTIILANPKDSKNLEPEHRWKIPPVPGSNVQ